jgi:quercetin dioxygenase-like cupin family protein
VGATRPEEHHNSAASVIQKREKGVFPMSNFADLSTDVKTIVGEPLEYPSSPNPVISSNIVTIAPGTVTPWMIHPVQPYLYVLEGTLIVEFAADGSRQSFKAGQAFLQTRTHWHRGRNDGTTPVRFLSVFVGARDVPTILHPPAGKVVEESTVHAGLSRNAPAA